MNYIKELKYGNTKCYCINDKIIIDTDWAGTLQAFYKCIKEQAIDLKKIKYLHEMRILWSCKGRTLTYVVLAKKVMKL